jgi:type I restriction enzyme, R subunit
VAGRFNVNYPHFKGEFARVITFKTEYAQNLIDNFSNKEKSPHLAISVDMLDTGIDVPEVVNLVFFKLVRSKTKFWQMVGRGTRLCLELFEPGKDKKFFYLFDYCQNLEYFSQNPETTDGAPGDALGTRLFKTRLELLTELDKKLAGEGKGEGGGKGEGEGGVGNVSEGFSTDFRDPKTEAEVRCFIAAFLNNEIASMNLDNFVVRPKRRLVEKYSKPIAWMKLSGEDISELAHEVAGLPSELEPESEEAKRFDLLILNLQLALLRAEPAFERLCNQVRDIAGLLEEKSAIPMVRNRMDLILDLQTDEWWENVTTPMLETVRRHLRSLVKLIEKHSRKPIYTDFEDFMGNETSVELPGFAAGGDFEKFRAKTRVFLLEHQDNPVIHKLRTNIALTSNDLDELEKVLSESGVGRQEDIVRAKDLSHGLGLFVRSLVGLDRETAKQSLPAFISDNRLTANQIEFINMIIDHLTEHGTVDIALLYESPFTDLTPQGPDGLFTSVQVDELIAALELITATATVFQDLQLISA